MTRTLEDIRQNLSDVGIPNEIVLEMCDEIELLNAEIATHWQARGQQMEEIVRLRELISYADDTVIESVLIDGCCKCDLSLCTDPCEYCAAKHFRRIVDLMKLRPALGQKESQ